MDVKAKFIEVLDKNVNQEQLVKDLAMELVFPWLEEKAKQTGTNIDDMLLAALKELVSK